MRIINQNTAESPQTIPNTHTDTHYLFWTLSPFSLLGPPQALSLREASRVRSFSQALASMSELSLGGSLDTRGTHKLRLGLKSPQLSSARAIINDCLLLKDEMSETQMITSQNLWELLQRNDKKQFHETCHYLPHGLDICLWAVNRNLYFPHRVWRPRVVCTLGIKKKKGWIRKMHIHSNPWDLPPISFQDQYFERYVWPWLYVSFTKKARRLLVPLKSKAWSPQEPLPPEAPLVNSTHTILY